jgi:pimeloyl-ACP methyl ester carboxylesterase
MKLETISSYDGYEPEISIVLVHGTWPRGWFPVLSRLWNRPCWFERGSSVISSIETSLFERQLLGKTEIRSFPWSGNNSFIARDKAAAALAAELLKQNEDFPKSRQVIIAHSHGGNVALRALYYLPAHFGKIVIHVA